MALLHNELSTISDFIKNTNSSDSDQLISIANFINQMNINDINIHSILKLIANLIKLKSENWA